MPEYTFHQKILSVSGVQVWTVTADTVEQARKKLEEGECELEHEEIEVTHVGEPELKSIKS